MIKYQSEMQEQYRILDLFDFTPYLDLYPDLQELMNAFEYECDITILPPEFENCVFNFITLEEFKEYLSKRYPYDFYETTTYKIIKREENIK